MFIDSFKQHFESVADPRQSAQVTYPFFDILFGSLCAVIAFLKYGINLAMKILPDYHRDSASFSNRCGIGAVRIPALAKSVTIHSRLNR